MSPQDPDAYQNLIIDLMEATGDSGGDSEVVYPLLQANLDKLDDNFLTIWREFAEAVLSRAEPAEAENIARDVFNLSLLVSEFPLGSKRTNMEISIVGYKILLTVFTYHRHPKHWAAIQHNLGSVYQKRIVGDRKENLEVAIVAYQLALQVRTLKALSTDWATTEIGLGEAYRNRIAGDRAENIELAIASFQLALQVYSKEVFPINWAMTQNNLGNAYWNRIVGDRAENIELAIASFQLALQVYSKEVFPIDWAMTQNNLGNTYCDRILGDRAENIELALASFQLALQVRAKEAFPIDLAMTQNNLGVAYWNRIAGDRAENLELAISSFQLALQVRTKEAFPIDWATTQNNLGLAYWNRIAGDRAKNIELAIASYQLALQVRTKEAFPMDWAMTQGNLGIAYWDRIAGDRGENIELAIASYQQALQVSTKEALPIQWATTQNNLGIAYWDRIAGDRGENIELAIASYQLALQVRTPETLPLDCLQTARSLGNLHYREGNWQRAIDAYETAAEAIDRVWQWAPTEERREQILTDDLQLYQNLVQSYLNIEQPAKALATVERTKSRNLLELVANLDIDPEGEFPPELLEELNRLRRAIFLRRGDAETPGRGEFRGRGDFQGRGDKGELESELRQLQQQLDRLLEEINRIDPGFSLTQRVEGMTAAEIGELVADGETAIIEWFVTGEMLVAFVVFEDSSLEVEEIATGGFEEGTKDLTRATPPRNDNNNFGEGTNNNLQIRVKEYAPQELRKLKKRANGYYRLYYRRDHRVWWRQQLQRRMEDLAQLLQIAELVALIPKKCQRLILIPHLYLHLLPLHALGDLFSRFPKGVQYAPSCQLLRLTQRRRQLQRQQPRKFFAIQNPTEDLTYTDLEVASAAKLFEPQTRVLEKTAARKSQLKREKLGSYNHHHFSCHGFFDPNNPKLSALILADAFVTAPATRSENRYLEPPVNSQQTLGKLPENPRLIPNKFPANFQQTPG